MTRLSGYQPQYFPRLHYFARALDSDVFEISDYLQFVRKHAYPQPDGTMKRGKSFQAHAPIKLANGIFHLSVPTHDEMNPINETAIAYPEPWIHKHIKSIETGYASASHFRLYSKELEQILRRDHQHLASLNILTILWGLTRLLSDEPLDVNNLTEERVNDMLTSRHPFRLKRVVLASKLPLSRDDFAEPNEWIIALCHHLGADEYYYGGTSHAAYMDEERFAKAGIRTAIQDWKCPPYSQQYQQLGFVPNLSIIDLILNEDLAGRQRVMQGAR